MLNLRAAFPFPSSHIRVIISFFPKFPGLRDDQLGIPEVDVWGMEGNHLWCFTIVAAQLAQVIRYEP
jgi:hypothetical protein